MTRRTWFAGLGSAAVIALILAVCSGFAPRAAQARAASEAPAPVAVAEVCAHPLDVSVSAAGSAHGGVLWVRLSERCTAASVVTARLCVTPPGGVRRCVRRILTRRIRFVKVATPRPGGWVISADVAGHPSVTHTRWVTPAGGHLTLLAAGDSEMQIVDNDLAEDLSGVNVISDARPSTGLENEWFFNWHQEAAVDVARYHPAVTMILMGGNAGFNITTAQGQVECCGPAWSKLYAEPVASLTKTFLDGGSGRVYWYTIPAASGVFAPIIAGVDRGIEEAVREFPGRAALINSEAFFTPGGRYRDYMTVDGHGLVIHEPDGIHLTSAADVYVAQLGVQALRADKIIR